jgi:exopolyphosphatase/guanosine-5'-triphosphate,3'-diphosphate pyrophosphatase
MALRLAENAAEFLERAATQETPVTVISGDTEAELGFASVADDAVFAGDDVVVVDVGGHSTEVSTQNSRSSFPVGTLGLRSNQLSHESPDSGAILQASAILDEVFDELPKASGKVVGLGASVTNLVSIREALTEWTPDRVHGAHLAYEEISRFVGRSMRMTDSERGAMTGIEQGRERTIHIGALIVERALLSLAAEAIYVSVRGWRHAILARWL